MSGLAELGNLWHSIQTWLLRVWSTDRAESRVCGSSRRTSDGRMIEPSTSVCCWPRMLASRLVVVMIEPQDGLLSNPSSRSARGRSSPEKPSTVGKTSLFWPQWTCVSRPRRAGPVHLIDQPADVPHQVDAGAVAEAQSPGVHLPAQARPRQRLALRRAVDDLEQLALRQLGQVNRHRFPPKTPAPCSATRRSGPCFRGRRRWPERPQPGSASGHRSRGCVCGRVSPARPVTGKAQHELFSPALPGLRHLRTDGGPSARIVRFR